MGGGIVCTQLRALSSPRDVDSALRFLEQARIRFLLSLRFRADGSRSTDLKFP